MRISTLKRRTEFDRVFQTGRFRRSDGLAVYAIPNQKNDNRYGFVITTKAGKAVVRNRLKRWSRELVQRWHDSLAKGKDIVVLANRPEAAASFESYAGHLAEALRLNDLVEAPLVH